MLFVRLFYLRLFGFVCFLFLLESVKGCGLWLWHSLDIYLTFLFICSVFFRHYLFLISPSIAVSRRLCLPIVVLPGFFLRLAWLIEYSINCSINSTKMNTITDLLIIDHLIYVFVSLPYLPLIFRKLTILRLKFEQVQFTTHCCLLNCLMNGKQCRPWRDAAFAASHRGSTLFAQASLTNTYNKVWHMIGSCSNRYYYDQIFSDYQSIINRNGRTNNRFLFLALISQP